MFLLVILVVVIAVGAGAAGLPWPIAILAGVALPLLGNVAYLRMTGQNAPTTTLRPNDPRTRRYLVELADRYRDFRYTFGAEALAEILALYDDGRSNEANSRFKALSNVTAFEYNATELISIWQRTWRDTRPDQPPPRTVSPSSAPETPDGGPIVSMKTEKEQLLDHETDVESQLVEQGLVPPAAVERYMAGLEMVIAELATRTDVGTISRDIEAAGVALDEARHDPIAAERLTASAAVLLEQLGRDQLTGAIVLRTAAARGLVILADQERFEKSSAPDAGRRVGMETQKESVLDLLHQPIWHGMSVIDIAKEVSNRGFTADDWKAAALAEIESLKASGAMSMADYSPEMQRVILTAGLVRSVLDGPPSAGAAKPVEMGDAEALAPTAPEPSLARQAAPADKVDEGGSVGGTIHHLPGGGQYIHFDASKPEDLRVIVENGLVWKSGQKAMQAAIDALIAGTLPMNDRVPADIRAWIEEARGEKDGA